MGFEGPHQLPGQEGLLWPSHHQGHVLALLGAAQHGDQLLLGPARYVHAVHLGEWQQ